MRGQERGQSAYRHTGRRAANGRSRHERVRGAATYTYQLQAFANAVINGAPILTPPEDAVVNMRLIDDVYQAAGLPLRGLAGA